MCQILAALGNQAGFPGGSDSKESDCNAGDTGSIYGLGRFPGGGHGNPFQYSCLENPKDRGAWWARVHGVAKSLTTESTSHVHEERQSPWGPNPRVPTTLAPPFWLGFLEGSVGRWERGVVQSWRPACPAVALWLQSFLFQNEGTQDANRFGTLQRSWLLFLLDL